MTCPACQHPDRQDVDVQLAQGAPLHSLSALFGIPQTVLKKHQDEHLRGLAVRISTEPGSVIFDLERAERTLWTVLKMAEGIKDPDSDPDNPKWVVKPEPNLMLKAIAEIGEMKVRQVKLAKELAMFKRDMVSRDTFNQMTEAVLNALAPYPEALTAVQSALAELPV